MHNKLFVYYCIITITKIGTNIQTYMGSKP